MRHWHSQTPSGQGAVRMAPRCPPYRLGESAGIGMSGCRGIGALGPMEAQWLVGALGHRPE